jgi:hypothetical protein
VPGAVVQHPTKSQATGTSCVLTVANPTLGNVLVAHANSDTTIPVPTDNGTGGVWTLRNSVVDGNGAYLWSKQVAAGDTTMTSVTFAVSPTDSIICGMIEVSSVTAAAFDVCNVAATQTGGAFTSTASVSDTTTGANGDFLIHLVALHASGTALTITSPSWSNGFTVLDSVSQNTLPREWTLTATLNQPVAAAIATVASWTGSATDAQGLLISLKLAAGSAKLPANALGRRTPPSWWPKRWRRSANVPLPTQAVHTQFLVPEQPDPRRNVPGRGFTLRRAKTAGPPLPLAVATKPPAGWGIPYK